MTYPVNNSCNLCKCAIGDNKIRSNKGQYHKNCWDRKRRLECIETENWTIVAQNVLIAAVVISVYSLFKSK